MPAPAAWSEPGEFWLPRNCRTDLLLGLSSVSVDHGYGGDRFSLRIGDLWHENLTFLTFSLEAKLSVLYLFAFSRTERVRKLIQIPSRWPKIHSRIPAYEETC